MYNQNDQNKQDNKEDKNKMKNYIIRYTENKGTTYNTILVKAESYTKAYVSAMMEIPNNGEITDLFEIIK